MRRTLFLLPVLLGLTLVVGCGGPDLPPTSDPEAIKKEQERLGGAMPGGAGKKTPANSSDPIAREQERLRQGK